MEQLAEDYQVPLEAVQEAIAYCQSSPPEIAQDFAFEDALMEASGMNEPDYRYRSKSAVVVCQEIAEIRRRGLWDMNLYLDDDSVIPLLIRLLRQAGHDVQLPADVANQGEEDPVHLTHAIKVQRVFLSHNYHDFQILHNLIRMAQGHHPGILVVRKDNDPARDLTPKGIVRAIARFIAAGVTIADQLVILNQWR